MTKDVYGYPCEPRNISDRAWYYEQREGVEVVVCNQSGQQSTVTLPWRRLESAVARHLEAKKLKRR